MGTAKGVLAITPDRELGKTLRVALTAAGAETTTIVSPAEIPRGSIDAGLVVLHHVGEGGPDVANIAARLKSGGQIIVLLPRSDLSATVAALQSHERVAGVLNADNVRPQEVTAMATRLLFGDIFGLEKVLPWGAHIHSLSVGDYNEKTDAIQKVSDFAASIGVRRKYRESIQQCCDEMLMNAMYDAPVDSSGKPLSGDPRQRPSLRGDDRAVIEYGCDGQRFAVAVRDRFGRMERSVLVRYLDKCLHSSQQIDQKIGGAGLGLYLMSNSATSLMFNVLPGVATECVCTFDLGSGRLKLEQLGVFKEHDQTIPREALRARGTVPTPIEPMAQAVRPPEPTGLGGGLTLWVSVAVLLLLGALAVVGLPRMFGWSRDAQAEAEGPEPAAVRVAQAAVAQPTGSLTIRTNVSGFVTVEGSVECQTRPLPLLRCPLPDGTHHVHLYGEDPRLSQSFTAIIKGGSVERHFAFGTVEARTGHGLALAADEPPFRRAAFPAGDHDLTLVDESSGARNPLKVPVHAGQTVIVP